MRLYNPRMASGSDGAIDVADDRNLQSRVGEDGLENSAYSVLQAGDVSQVIAKMAGGNPMTDDESESIWSGICVVSSYAHEMHNPADDKLLDAMNTLLPEVALLYEQHDVSSYDLGADEASALAEGDLDGIIDTIISTEPAPGLETIMDDRDVDVENEEETEEPEPPDDLADVLQM